MGFFSKKIEPAPEPKRFGCLWRWSVAILLLLILLPYGTGLLLEAARPRMPDMNARSAAVSISHGDLLFLRDISGVDARGKPVIRQEIFTALRELIDSAHRLLVLDMFLINQFNQRHAPPPYRDISAELVAALVHKLKTEPEVFVLFITDPINSVYGEECPPVLQPLVEAGGHVVLTDLAQLPDSNRLYSPFYRALRPVFTHLPWMRQARLRNPFEPGADRVSPAQFLRMLNFKANHRKLAIADDAGGGLTALITSANPHSASSAHSNVGLLMRAGPLREMLRQEYRLALASVLESPELSFSRLKPLELVREIEKRLPAEPIPDDSPDYAPAVNPEPPTLQYVTDAAIGEAVDRLLRQAEPGDRVDLLMFYLADPDVLEGIREAAARGAAVRLVLDPNRDAFGRRKQGIPNRVVARGLHDWAAKTGHNVSIRWMLTHGEQAHFKLLRVHARERGCDQLLLGSANFTRRNLRGDNLEAAVLIDGAGTATAAAAALFTDLWENRGAVIYTAPYAEFAPAGMLWWLGRAWTAIGTATGFSTY